MGTVRRREFLAIAAVLGAAGPLARAQEVPVVGFLNLTRRAGGRNLAAAFARGLGEAGFVEGRDVIVDYRWAEGDPTRLPALADDLVARRVAVITVGGGPAARQAVRQRAGTTPVVFVTASDPVQEGLVASLNRPGANFTGVSLLSTGLGVKRLELLRELLPSATRIAVLVNPAGSGTVNQLDELQAAGRALGVTLHRIDARNPAEIEAAFVRMSTVRAEGLLVTADPVYNGQRELLIRLAAARAMPAVYEWREFPEAGGLMSYGTSVGDGYRRAGVYVGRILKGARPSELPVVQSDRFETVLNLQAAKALGIAFPPSLRLRADELIP